MISKFLLVLIIPFLIAAGQLFLKKGVGVWGLEKLDFSFSNILSLVVRVFQSGWLIAGLLVFWVGFLLYLFALSKFQLNIIYPVMVSAAMVIVSFVSWLLFKESLSLLQILGVIVIIFGIFLLMPRA